MIDFVAAHHKLMLSCCDAGWPSTQPLKSTNRLPRPPRTCDNGTRRPNPLPGSGTAMIGCVCGDNQLCTAMPCTGSTGGVCQVALLVVNFVTTVPPNDTVFAQASASLSDTKSE